LDEIPDSESSVASSGSSGDSILTNLGLDVSKLTPELRRQYKIESRTGLIVTGVAEGSMAQKAGFQEGDLLLEVNGRKVSDTKDLGAALNRSSKSVAFLIERNGRTFFVSLKTE
jgi:S1-C subfamily serine protease